MTTEEFIKILCVRLGISVAELARRLGTTPQNLNGKLHRDSLTIVDMERIAEATGTRFKREFVLKNGETV